MESQADSDEVICRRLLLFISWGCKPKPAKISDFRDVTSLLPFDPSQNGIQINRIALVRGLGSNGTESALKRPPLDLAVASTRLWLRTPAWGRLRKRKKSYAKEVMRLESNDRALVRTLQGSLPHRVATHRWPVVFWPTQSCCRSSAVFALLFGQADGRFQARP